MIDDPAIVAGMQVASVPLTTGLMVVILRKAGFGWGWAMLGLAPVPGAALNALFLTYGLVSFAFGLGLSLLVGLLPLLLLAFGRWPRLAVIYPRSETFQ